MHCQYHPYNQPMYHILSQLKSLKHIFVTTTTTLPSCFCHGHQSGSIIWKLTRDIFCFSQACSNQSASNISWWKTQPVTLPAVSCNLNPVITFQNIQERTVKKFPIKLKNAENWELSICIASSFFNYVTITHAILLNCLYPLCHQHPSILYVHSTAILYSAFCSSHHLSFYTQFLFHVIPAATHSQSHMNINFNFKHC